VEAQSKKYLPDSLKKDAQFIYETYTNWHVAPYLFCDSIIFEKAYHEFISKINRPITINEFYRYACLFISVTNDAHTLVVINPETFKLGVLLFKKFIYFDIEIKDNRIYVKQIYRRSSDIKIGNEILSINGIKSDSILKGINSFYSDHNVINKYDCFSFRFFINLWTLFDLYGKFQIEYKDITNNNVYTEKMRGMSLIPRIIRENKIDTLNINTPCINRDGQMYRKCVKPLFWLTDTVLNKGNFTYSRYSYWVMPNSKTCIIHSRKVDVPDNYIQSFFDSVFTHISAINPDNLVIDLRDNDGGYFGAIPFFVKYFYKGEFIMASSEKIKVMPDHIKWLKQYRDTLIADCLEPYVGKLIDADTTCFCKFAVKVPVENKSIFYNGFKNIYILTSSSTQSMAVLFADAMKYNIPNVKIIGEETGGLRCTLGGKIMIELPYSKLYMGVSSSYTQSPFGNCDKRGLIPDIIIDAKDAENKLLEIINH